MYINHNHTAAPVSAMVIPADKFLDKLYKACCKTSPSFTDLYPEQPELPEDFAYLFTNADEFGFTGLPYGLDYADDAFCDKDSLNNNDIAMTGNDCLGVFTTEKGVTVLNIAMANNESPYAGVISVYLNTDGNVAFRVPHLGNPIDLNGNVLLGCSYILKDGTLVGCTENYTIDDYLRPYGLTENDAILNGDGLTDDINQGFIPA